MKRVVILIGITLSFLLIVSGTAMGQSEDVLIDFSELVEDVDGENEATTIDFSTVAGTSFTEKEKEQMKTSLKISNWEVKLASSSQTVENMRYSKVMPTPVSENSRFYAGDTVLGVRIHFPQGDYNSWAMVQPPFEIPAYATNDEESAAGNQLNMETGRKFDGYGVLKNVGTMKEVTMSILGRNFPHGVSLMIEDENGEERELFMKYVDHRGWRDITWANPNYIEDVRNRELRTRPMYPKSAPMIKLKGIVFYRDKEAVGGDFVSYVKDVSVVYDKAIIDEEDQEVDDEAVWGILAERERARRNTELQRLGEKMVLRMLEEEKMQAAGGGEATDAEEGAEEPATEPAE